MEGTNRGPRHARRDDLVGHVSNVPRHDEIVPHASARGRKGPGFFLCHAGCRTAHEIIVFVTQSSNKTSCEASAPTFVVVLSHIQRHSLLFVVLPCRHTRHSIPDVAPVRIALTRCKF